MRHTFATHNLFFTVRFTFGELYSKNIKIKVRRYIGTSLCKYQDHQDYWPIIHDKLEDLFTTIIHSFQDFYTKIYLHTKQAKLVNALRHWYEGTRPNSHVIYTKKAIKLFQDFSIFMVFEFFKTLKNRTRKVRSIKTSTKQNL